jgi:hypothetical protein
MIAFRRTGLFLFIMPCMSMHDRNSVVVMSVLALYCQYKKPAEIEPKASGDLSEKNCRKIR